MKYLLILVLGYIALYAVFYYADRLFNKLFDNSYIFIKSYMENIKNKYDFFTKLIIVVGFFVLGYLFMLNGRYELMDSKGNHIVVLDKWKGEVLLPVDELVFQLEKK